MEQLLKELSILKKTSLFGIIMEAINQYLFEIKIEQEQKKNPLYELVSLCENGKVPIFPLP